MGSFPSSWACSKCGIVIRIDWYPKFVYPEEKGECVEVEEYETEDGIGLRFPKGIEAKTFLAKVKKANQGGKPYVDNDIPNVEFKKPSENQEGEGHQGAYQGGCKHLLFEGNDRKPLTCNKCGKLWKEVYAETQKPSEEERAWRRALVAVLERCLNPESTEMKALEKFL